MQLQKGKRYLTRSGAIAEIVTIEDTGLVYYDYHGKPLGTAKLIRCKIVRRIDGTPHSPTRMYFVDGRGLQHVPEYRREYDGPTSPLDLIREATKDEASDPLLSRAIQPQ